VIQADAGGQLACETVKGRLKRVRLRRKAGLSNALTLHFDRDLGKRLPDLIRLARSRYFSVERHHDPKCKLHLERRRPTTRESVRSRPMVGSSSLIGSFAPHSHRDEQHKRDASTCREQVLLHQLFSVVSRRTDNRTGVFACFDYGERFGESRSSWPAVGIERGKSGIR
jgi:hypothetical protein